MQASLFDDIKATDPGLTQPPPAKAMARRTDPESSKIAAKQFVQRGQLKSHEEQITWLSDSRGKDWTTHELANDFKQKLAENLWLDSVQITRRLKGLEQKEVIEFVAGRICNCGCCQPMNAYRSKRA
jgi:hypothetical protein